MECSDYLSNANAELAQLQRMTKHCRPYDVSILDTKNSSIYALKQEANARASEHFLKHLKTPMDVSEHLTILPETLILSQHVTDVEESPRGSGAARVGLTARGKSPISSHRKY